MKPHPFEAYLMRLVLQNISQLNVLSSYAIAEKLDDQIERKLVMELVILG